MTTSSQAVRLIFLFLVSVPLSQAAATWTTIDVPGATSTYAAGINNLGQVVGAYGDPVTGNHGFLLSGGTFTTIDFPGKNGTVAYGINDSGQIVGAYQDNGSPPHAFLLDGQTFTTIDFPGAAGTDALAINNSGQIVGFYEDASLASHGFLWTNGVFATIDPPRSREAVARGINDEGDIVGYDLDLSAHGVQEGFIYSGGRFKTKIIYPGALATVAVAVNDKRKIVGDRLDGIGYHGFALFHGSFVAVNYPGSKRSDPLGINLAGDIVGNYYDSKSVPHGFLRTHGVD